MHRRRWTFRLNAELLESRLIDKKWVDFGGGGGSRTSFSRDKFLSINNLKTCKMPKKSTMRAYVQNLYKRNCVFPGKSQFLVQTTPPDGDFFDLYKFRTENVPGCGRLPRPDSPNSIFHRKAKRGRNLGQSGGNPAASREEFRSSSAEQLRMRRRIANLLSCRIEPVHS
jgi:hypothetical protein